MSYGKLWTEDLVDQLKALWAEGLTASEIAKRIEGFSRSAILGKAHRLNLATRADAVRGRRAPPIFKAPRKLKLSAIAKAMLGAAPRQAPATGDVPTESLERKHCKWPVTEEAPWFHCGAQRIEGSPYCAHHTVAAFNPMPKVAHEEAIAA